MKFVIREKTKEIQKKACYLLADSVNRANKSGKTALARFCGPGAARDV
jgi:hypothetical protein